MVSLLITRKGLLLIRKWLGYASAVTLWILSLQVLWPIGSGQAATQLQICRCEDRMHLLDGYWKICVRGGYFSSTLEGGWMGDNLEYFAEVLGLFLVFCLSYYYICHIHAWRAVLRVYNVGINRWDGCCCERHLGSDRTPCVAIMWFVVWYLYPAECSRINWWSANAFYPIARMILVMDTNHQTCSILVNCHS